MPTLARMTGQVARPRPLAPLLTLVLTLILAGGWPLAAPEAARAQVGAGAVNPVVPGEFPDPTVVRTPTGYWAMSTSGEQAPVFPIMHSRDLVNWTQVGAVFDRPPLWTAGAYWGPQLTHYGNRFLLYYAARRQGRHPCIGLAAAARPQGPYHDRGPVVCQPQGSIDPMFYVAPDARPYLMWKQMGVGHGLWIQATNRSGTAVVGPRSRMIVPDQHWEHGVTENPFMLANGGQYYLLYSGGTCCRLPCTYAIGVARSDSLTGPYVKDPSGPVFSTDDTWRCPGAPSYFDDPGGGSYLMFHAYRTGEEYLGRQGLIDQLAWGSDGWPVIGDGHGPRDVVPVASPEARAASRPVDDRFAHAHLAPGWEWPWDERPAFRFARGDLRISVSYPGDELAAYMGRRVVRSSLQAVVGLDRRSLHPRSTLAGLAIYAGPYSALGLGLQGSNLVLWEHTPDNPDVRLAQTPLSAPSAGAGQLVWLRLRVSQGRQVEAAWSWDRTTWMPVTSTPVMQPGHPRGERVVLDVAGPRGAVAGFRRFVYDGLR